MQKCAAEGALPLYKELDSFLKKETNLTIALAEFKILRPLLINFADFCSFNIMPPLVSSTNQKPPQSSAQTNSDAVPAPPSPPRRQLVADIARCLKAAAYMAGPIAQINMGVTRNLLYMIMDGMTYLHMFLSGFLNGCLE